MALSTHTNYNRCRRSNLILYDRNLSNELGDESFTFTPKRITYLVLWVGLVAYTFLLSPGGSVEASAKDTELIKTIISTPFDGSVSPVFVAIFNALGILPAVLGSLLLSGGGKNQRVPAFPFVFSSFFLGFFGIGPYLFLRKPMTDVTYEDRGFGTSAFEPKLTAVGMLAFAMGLSYYALSSEPLAQSVSSYIALFQTQRLVHVSSIDFTILSLAMWDPMTEDMVRRKWTGPGASLFCALPVIGPVMYLLLRPSLESSEEG